MKYIKIIALSLSLVIFSAIAFTGAVNAQSFKSGDTVTVASEETIESMLFAGGNNLDIAGTVNGDVFCAGQTITISGTVNGNARVAGQTITLSGNISDSATVGAQSLVIDSNSIIGRDLLGGSQTITVNGQIKRDFVVGANSLTVNGKIDRNVKGGVETITVGSDGTIGGTVEYTGKNDPSISSGGKIVGTITRTEPKTETKNTSYAPIAFTAGSFIYFLIMMLILGAVVVAMFPRIFKESSAKTIEAPGKAAIVGLSAAFIAPVLAFLLFITIVGIPLAALILLAMLMAFVLSGPFVGYMLGRIVLPESKQPIWTMMAGIVILVVTFFIPIIGFLSIFATYILGTGMILIENKKLIDRPSTKK